MARDRSGDRRKADRARQRADEAKSAYEEQAKRQEGELAKTERLRALRLAKEAADAKLAAKTKARERNAPQRHNDARVEPRTK
jgi:hypothetical protein